MLQNSVGLADRTESVKFCQSLPVPRFCRPHLQSVSSPRGRKPWGSACRSVDQLLRRTMGVSQRALATDQGSVFQIELPAGDVVGAVIMNRGCQIPRYVRIGRHSRPMLPASPASSCSLRRESGPITNRWHSDDPDPRDLMRPHPRKRHAVTHVTGAGAPAMQSSFAGRALRAVAS